LKQVKDIEKIFQQENAEIKNEMKQIQEKKNVAKNELVFANKEIKELKGEVSQLKEEIKTMRHKTDLVTDKHNLTNEPSSPSFYPSMNLMMAGLERFIEHNRVTIVGPYTDYIKWFDFVFQEVQVNDELCCQYENYLFMKIKFPKKYHTFSWLSSVGKRRKIIVQLESPTWTFKTCTLGNGWSQINTKFALVLHPNDISKVVELKKNGFDDTYEKWKAEKVSAQFYSADNELIICCKKTL